jgi:hypothetical protein
VQTALVFGTAAAEVEKDTDLVYLMKQSAAKGPAQPGTRNSSRSSTQRSDVYFQNDFLRVEIASASKAGKSVSVGLRLRNISREPLLIALPYGCEAHLLDDRGNALIARRIPGLGCVSARYSDPDAFTQIAPATETVVVMTFGMDYFTASRVLELGTTFSLTMDALRFVAKNSSRFSIGMAGIEIR